MLRFWTLPLSQVHLLFARHLVGFIIICKVLGVSTSCDLFRRYHWVRHGKGLLSRPSKIKDWKNRFFFVREPHLVFKSFWTARKRLPSPPVKLDAELQHYGEIINHYPYSFGLGKVGLGRCWRLVGFMMVSLMEPFYVSICGISVFVFRNLLLFFLGSHYQ